MTEHVLRFLNNKSAWEPLSEFDVSPDALKSVQTDSAKLSLYRASSQLEVSEAVAAFAAARGRKNLDRVDYCLFSESLIVELGFSIETSLGDTGSDLVNSRHIDITIPNCRELICFVHGMVFKSGTFVRARKGEVSAFIVKLLGRDQSFERGGNQDILREFLARSS